MQNRFKIAKILRIRISRAGLEVLGDPVGAKMAQDASWIASGAPFGDLLGLILSPRWPKLRKNGAKMLLSWPTWSPRWSTWHHFGRHLGHFSWFWGRSLQKSPKCKSDQPSITFSVFLRVGAFLEWSWELSWAVLERYFGRRWLQDGVFGSIFSDVAGSWRQDGEQKHQHDFHFVFFTPSLQKC